MNWLNQFFMGTGNGFVSTLFVDILSSPIGSVIYYLNIVISIISIFFICQQVVSRALRAGEDGRLPGATALAIRLSIIPLFCVPVAAGGKLSLAQLATLKMAEAGSNFGDFIFSKMPLIGEAIPLSFASSTSSTPRIPYISSDSAVIVGKIYSLRYCQFRLAWLDLAYAIPAPTISKTIAGTQIIQFGGPHQMRLPADACGTISLPPSAAEIADDRIAKAVNAFSSNRVTDAILNSHRTAITMAIADAGSVLRNANPHVGLADAGLWTQIAMQIRASAAQYESAVASAGGAVFVKNDGSNGDAILDQEFGWLRAGFTLSARSSQIVGRVAAFTWRPTIDVQDASRIYPLTFSPDQYQSLDRQFLNALQSAGAAKTPQGASASGLSLESFLGVGEIRAAAELLTNPHANVFEVAASVGPLLTASAAIGLAAYAAVSAVLPGVGTFISVVLGTLALAGQGLTIVVQMAPAIAWLFLLLGWFVGILLLFVSVSFYAIPISRENGDELFLSGKLSEIFGRAIIVLLTPALLVIGLALVLPVINVGWFFIVKAISPAVKAAASESVIASAISMILIVLFIVTLISSLIYFAILKVAGVAKFIVEILETRESSALSAGERISGGETVSTTPGMMGGGARQPNPQGTPGALRAGGQTSALAGTNGGTLGGIDKNAGHVVASTKGSPK